MILDDAHKQLIAANLLRAADLVEAGNWCQNAWAKARNGRSVAYNHEGACKFCAVSAVNKTAILSERTAGEAVLQCGAEIYKIGGITDREPHRATLMSWNDASHRTKDDVAALFRKVAHRLHPEGQPSLMETASG